MAGYPRVTHPSATKLYSVLTEISAPHNSVRLACVKHAASVHPEPGSNSRNKVCFPSRTTSLAIPSVLTVFRFVCFRIVPIWVSPSQTVLWNSYESSGLHYCLVFKVRLVCFPRRNSDIISSVLVCVKTFFILFEKVIPPFSAVEFYNSTFSRQLSTVLKNLYKISL